MYERFSYIIYIIFLLCEPRNNKVLLMRVCFSEQVTYSVEIERHEQPLEMLARLQLKK